MNRRKFFAIVPAAVLAPVAAHSAVTERVAYRATATVDGYGTLTITDDSGRKRMTVGPAGVTTYGRDEQPEYRLNNWHSA